MRALYFVVAAWVLGSGLAARAVDGVTRDEAIGRTRARIEALLERHGGREAIRVALRPLLAEVREVLAREKEEGQRFPRVGSYHFAEVATRIALRREWARFRGTASADAPASGGQSGAPSTSAHDVIVDFDRKLRAQGIDLIVVPVPAKIEAYARVFGVDLPAGMPISTERHAAMLRLLASGVEVVDVLPALLAAMTDEDSVPLYEEVGQHISGFGVRLAAREIAARLERYELAGRDPSRFTELRRDSAFESVRPPPVPMLAWEVQEGGETYRHTPLSEVVVIGDSNAFVFRSASMAAHIARCAGLEITEIATAGGASTAHARLAGQGLALLKKRKVVIWLITSTDLERGNWKPTSLPERPTFMGLICADEVEEALRLFEEHASEPGALGIRRAEVSDLGQRLLEQGQNERALAVFKLNTRAFPYSAEAHEELAGVYDQLDESELAIESYKLALGRGPSELVRARAVQRLGQLGVDYVPPAPHRLSQARIAQLLGTYTFEGWHGEHAGAVTLEDDELVFEFAGQPKLLLRPLSDELLATTAGMTLRIVDSDSSSPLLVFSGRGLSFEGKRIADTRALVSASAPLAPTVPFRPQGGAPYPSWPARAEHVAFAFATSLESVLAYDKSDGEPLFNYSLERAGFAWFDRVGALRLEHGSATAARISAALVERLRAGSGLTLEACLTPAARTKAAETILRLGTSDAPCFALAQEPDGFVFQVRSGPAAAPVELRVDIQPPASCHVLVTTGAGGLTLFLDGQPVAQRDDVVVDFDAWDAGPLSFGCGSVEDAGWSGTLEGVAIRAEGLSGDEARESAGAYARKRQARKPVEVTKLRGRLRAKSRVPTVAEISPYRESLAVFEYEVVRVEAGFYLAKTIRVAHWVVLGETALEAGRMPLGSTVDLTLERFADQPQLEKVNLVDTLELDFDAELYFDAGGAGLRRDSGSGG